MQIGGLISSTLPTDVKPCKPFEQSRNVVSLKDIFVYIFFFRY